MCVAPGACTDVRLTASAYAGASSAPSFIGFAVGFTGVPALALNASVNPNVMLRATQQAVLQALQRCTPTIAGSMTSDSVVVVSASEAVAGSRRRRRLAAATGSPTYVLRLVLPAGVSAATSAAALNAQVASLNGNISSFAGAALRLTPSLASVSMAQLASALAAPPGSPAGSSPFATLAALPAIVELVASPSPGPVGTGGGGDAKSGGGGGGGGGAGAAAAIIVVILLGFGGGFFLCRTRGSFFGMPCTPVATCCGYLPPPKPFVSPLQSKAPEAGEGSAAAAAAADVKVVVSPLAPHAKEAAAAPAAAVPSAAESAKAGSDAAATVAKAEPADAPAQQPAADTKASEDDAPAADAAADDDETPSSKSEKKAKKSKQVCLPPPTPSSPP